MAESRLDHPPLTFPEFSFAHHKAITEEPGNTFDRQAFFVILPILAKDVLRVLGGTDHIYARTVDRRFIDVAVSFEIIVHPTQEILSWAVGLVRPWWIKVRRSRVCFGHHTCVPNFEPSGSWRRGHWDVMDLVAGPSINER